MIKLMSLVAGLMMIGSCAIAADKCNSRDDSLKIYNKVTGEVHLVSVMVKDKDAIKITESYNKMATYYKMALEKDVTEIWVAADPKKAMMVFVHKNTTCTDDVKVVGMNDFRAIIMDAYNLLPKKEEPKIEKKDDDSL